MSLLSARHNEPLPKRGTCESDVLWSACRCSPKCWPAVIVTDLDTHSEPQSCALALLAHCSLCVRQNRTMLGPDQPFQSLAAKVGAGGSASRRPINVAEGVNRVSSLGLGDRFPDSCCGNRKWKVSEDTRAALSVHTCYIFMSDLFGRSGFLRSLSCS